MSNDDIIWRKSASQDRNPNDQETGTEVPGDTDAADIVGRTGEEMPEVAHDARRESEEAEGQLGPDELPDPTEVIMNHEAKLHH